MEGHDITQKLDPTQLQTSEKSNNKNRKCNSEMTKIAQTVAKKAFM